MTTIMVGMQDSLLVLESSNRHRIDKRLKGTNPQSIVFDPRNRKSKLAFISIKLRHSITCT
jgi:hypothetical protein